jgi:hypothetical protein
MLQVDDLIEPGAKQILFTRLSSFPWPHDPSPKPFEERESRIKFARNTLPNRRFPANSISTTPRFKIPNQRLGHSSRTTN